MVQVASQGVVGTYPNGGFPAQAFYGVMGGLNSSAPSTAPTSSGTNTNPLNLGSSKYAVLGTVFILVFGGYFLWHKTY
jgi:hypothetical protein